MELRRGGWSGRVGVVQGVACLVAVLAIGALSDSARGGNESSQREDLRLKPTEKNLVELGRRLFFEPALSHAGLRACASCHEPTHGFADARQFSPEDIGQTLRHSQSLVDVDLEADQHWDGEFLSVAALVSIRSSQPITPTGYGESERTVPDRRPRRPDTPELTVVVDTLGAEPAPDEPNPLKDLGLGDVTTDMDGFLVGKGFLFGGLDSMLGGEDGTTRLARSGRYLEALTALRSDGRPGRLDVETAGKAIEAYLGTLRSTRAPYDRYRTGDKEALSASAQRGLALFRGRGRCVACHKESGPSNWPLFRDDDYHNNGVAFLSEREGVRVLARNGMVLKTPEPTFDEGRGRFLAAADLKRAFKTPSLRDVARHPPYMHDGSKATLAEVVAHYAAGCGDDPERDPRLKGFEATPQDRDDLVAFLTALTSEDRPGLAPEAWKKRAERTRLRFVDARRQPLVGLRVGLETAGDVVPVERAAALPSHLETDAKGEIAYVVPASTHVRLRLPDGLKPDGGSLVPDTCSAANMILPVHGRLRLAFVIDDSAVVAPESLRAYEPFEHENREVTLLRPFVPTPWTLARQGTVWTGNQRVVLYEGYRMRKEAVRLAFRLPGQTAPQAFALDGPKEEAGVIETQRVDVTPEGTPALRELASGQPHILRR